MNGTGSQMPGGQGGPVFSGPACPPSRGKSVRARIIVLLAAVLGLAVVLGSVVALVQPGQASASPVHLDAASAPGDNPFTPPATDATGSDTDQTSDSSAPGSVVAPASPGTNILGTCDPAKLSAYLVANPAPAAAWVQALNSDPTLQWSGGNHLSTDQIPAYISELTHQVLTQDTRVTNFAFQNGVAVPFQSVLQAGTAVLIDHEGVARARCACGNPLTPMLHLNGPANYTGTPWTGFEPPTSHCDWWRFWCHNCDDHCKPRCDRDHDGRDCHPCDRDHDGRDCHPCDRDHDGRGCHPCDRDSRNCNPCDRDHNGQGCPPPCNRDSRDCNPCDRDHNEKGCQPPPCNRDHDGQGCPTPKPLGQEPNSPGTPGSSTGSQDQQGQQGHKFPVAPVVPQPGSSTGSQDGPGHKFPVAPVVPQPGSSTGSQDQPGHKFPVGPRPEPVHPMMFQPAPVQSPVLQLKDVRPRGATSGTQPSSEVKGR